MDSGNSRSLQTSSNGDDEYDSRAAAADSFFSTTHQPPPPPLFDPLSHYNTLLLNPNISWPETIRPDPNPTFQPPTVQYDAHQLEPNRSQTTARNSKKRSRASRRAPTTFLTTDTSNFRAMVQEFTGIPAHPFDNTNSSFSTTRLDLFGMRSATLEMVPPPPYLRHSFAQKLQSPPPFLVSSSSLPSSNIFSSLIQSNPKFLFSNSCDSQSSFQMQSNDTQIGLPNLTSPDQNVSQNESTIDDANAERWRDGGGDDYETQMKRIRYGGIMD